MQIGNADFSEQKRISAVTIPDVVTVVGTGAFGAWAAFFSALAGVQRLVLINPGSSDKNDRHNIHGREIACGPFLDSDLGRPKVDALAEIILSHRPNIDISKHIVFWDETKADLLEGVVFAGISSNKSQDQIWATAARKGLKCFGGSYNGAKCGVATHRQEMPDIDSSAPAWAGSAALSGVLAVQAAFVRPFHFFGEPGEILRQASCNLSLEVASI